MTRFLSFVAASLLTLCSVGQSQASPIGFAVDTNSNLLSVDLGTASATVIGSTGQFLEGLAISPGGNLYGTNTSGQLFSINSLTGASTLIGSTGLGNIEGLAFKGNTLVGTNFTNPTSLYSINTSTGVASLLVTTTPNHGVIRGMAIQGNTAFASSDSPSFQSLLSIDLTTGATTVLGSMGTNGIYGLAFGSGGVLYGLGDSGRVYTINTGTGAPTLVGSTGSQFYLDLAIPAAAVVPEPATLFVFGAMAVGAFGVRRRRMKAEAAA